MTLSGFPGNWPINPYFLESRSKAKNVRRPGGPNPLSGLRVESRLYITASSPII